MDSSVSPKDEIWFLRVRHHISNTVYNEVNQSPLCHSSVQLLEACSKGERDLANKQNAQQTIFIHEKEKD